MWRLGFFFHEMAFGLLSVFIPLYVVTIGGSLVHIGIMSAVALSLAIPSSFFWGYACDRTRHYKRYILLAFLALAVILYLFTLTTSIELLITLYAVMSILHMAHEPPKNVLIAESYSHEDWEKVFAFYEGFTEAGWLIGLFLGFLTSAYGLGAVPTLVLCSALNLVAFFSSLLLVTDPPLIFERGLVSIENGRLHISRDGFGVKIAERDINKRKTERGKSIRFLQRSSSIFPGHKHTLHAFTNILLKRFSSPSKFCLRNIRVKLRWRNRRLPFGIEPIKTTRGESQHKQTCHVSKYPRFSLNRNCTNTPIQCNARSCSF